MHTLLHKTEITLIFASQKQGVLAHLARARHWQCRGERFESAILHKVYLQGTPYLFKYHFDI